MNVDQLSQIRPAIREVIEGSPNLCITMEVEGVPELCWLQLMKDVINAAYPFADDPAERIKALPSIEGLAVGAWEPRKFATFEISSLSDPALPRWIDAYFVTVLGCPEGGYDLNLRSELM